VLPEGVGGVVAFELQGGYEAAERYIDALTRFKVAASLGGTCSLVTWPAGVTHAGLSPAQRQEAGIEDGLVRVAVGLEDPEELWNDMQRAFIVRSSGG
jgi:cystathionine beta-lyase/cystathionine gamma-synthase